MRTRIGRPAINGGVRGTAVGLAKAKPAFGPAASHLAAAAAAAATPAASAAPTTVDPIGPLQEVTRVPVHVTVQQRSVELKISGSVVRRIHGTQNDGRLRSTTSVRRRRRARAGGGVVNYGRNHQRIRNLQTTCTATSNKREAAVPLALGGRTRPVAACAAGQTAPHRHPPPTSVEIWVRRTIPKHVGSSSAELVERTDRDAHAHTHTRTHTHTHARTHARTHAPAGH